MTLLKASFDDLFAGAPVMVILRGHSVERTVELATSAWDLGIVAVEIPIQDETAVEALRSSVEAGRARGMLVGAGTVISPEHVRQAAEAGASFTVSPGLDVEIAQLSLENGLPTMPGVATASDIQLALRLGLTWMKAFPAAQLGSSWFKSMNGPFPMAKFVATGGVSTENAREFLAAGAQVVALSSAVSDFGSRQETAEFLQQHARGLGNRRRTTDR
ncbi:bifunctional 4-hydroxy-2-oxoglutarate aldolase/2-dehydro-3-deoxy-phosphogluconate aldolase [Pseudarthrobacter sp. SSS035]|uniref:bifunctional 4-hydroxy-2-oxoglutarate aldolase/2-dehydro-3-deoxy-phosphogluconate aldolase n=1 Tax=Pseudarthrobacter sp. SSS035 TaxID=2931399 RepID=UPI00200BF841|nr:bifunctional 4-hydroxy-2-oxoglutarate aldolase/2-dehydro-3-deoxy-phosphogluconate aldolase [Pseudarthrobacter sp. SSS035]